MTPEERRELLEAVARGDLTPDEAAEQMSGAADASPEPPTAATTPPATESVSPPPPSDSVARRVRVIASAAKVEIVGDSSIAEAIAEGECEMYREGDTLVVSADAGTTFSNFAFRFDSRRGHRRFVTNRPETLLVRVNPNISLDLDANAASVRVVGVKGPIECDVNAGSVRLRDTESPVRAAVNAGALKWTGKLNEGASRVSCDAGSVKIQLDEGSDVTIRAEANLGKAQVRGGTPQADGSVVVGSGWGTLDVEGSVSSIVVSVEPVVSHSYA